MAKKQFIANSLQTLENAIRDIRAQYGDGAYLIIDCKEGKQATMPQKALLHIWLRTYAAHLLRKPERDVSKIDMLAMKRSAKTKFYNQTHETFMVEEITDPFHPDKQRKELTSIADWSQADCYMFMTWLQTLAMDDGLILESTGEHQRLAQESYGK